MQVSETGRDLVAAFEGFQPEAYLCPAGVWTVGFGTTTGAGVGKVGPGTRMTRKQAESALQMTLDKFAVHVEAGLRRKPSQAQFDAMVSLAYNIGLNGFAGSSVRRWFNAGHFARAADAFLLWNKANGKVLSGLVRRRYAERDLFLS